MRLFVIVLSVIAVAGCATQYHAQGFAGGFTETQLGENVFQINVKGNAYTSRERASDYAMLRASELTLENGFTYFSIADSDEHSQTSTHTTPTQTYSNYGQGTYTTGGQAYNYNKPRSELVVVMFHGEPQNAGLVFDAKYVETSLKKKYKIEE